MPQPRVPKGTPSKGRVHPGEFAAEPKKRGRGHAGSPIPKSAPIHQAPSGQTGSSAAEREALAKQHESRLPDEMAGNFRCSNCGWAGWREHAVVTREGKMHATLAFQGCTRCGTMHPAHVGVAGKYSPQHSTARKEAARPSRTAGAATGGGNVMAQAKRSTRPMKSAIRKTIDTGETALLAAPEGVEYVGHRLNCPRGGESPCGKAVGGKCGVCAAPVQDHEAIGKTDAVLLDLRKLAGLA